MNNKKDHNSKNGMIFIYISLSILTATIISAIFSREINYYFYAMIWIGSFLVFFLLFRTRIIDSVKTIKTRIKKSTRWPLTIKIINGICWAGPFFFAVFMPVIHEFLILLGIGLGNISTALIFLKYNRLKNKDQMIVGLICLISIVIIMVLYQYDLIAKVQGEFLARILISIAYGIGGVYSLFSGEKDTYSNDIPQ
jgi:hypothetical protein